MKVRKIKRKFNRKNGLGNQNPSSSVLREERKDWWVFFCEMLNVTGWKVMKCKQFTFYHFWQINVAYELSRFWGLTFLFA
jgi:hypothetical protein